MATREVEVTGRSFGGIRPKLQVVPGDTVRRGDVLFVDAKRPRIAFVSPFSGVVRSVEIGRRRLLDRIVIDADGNAVRSFGPLASDARCRDLRELMLQSGLWTRLRVRPYGRIPDPDDEVSAIFVTATRADPLMPDPALAIDRQHLAFAKGLALLAMLTDGPVHLCHETGVDVTAFRSDRVRTSAFTLGRPGGLPGFHIARFAAVSEDRPVLQVGYADVIDLAKLAQTGRLPEVTGSDVFSGHEKGSASASARFARWLNASTGGAIVPREALDRAVPPGILAVPLMRALSIGDVETVRALGGLGLVEEDMAALTRLCASGADYGMLLRAALDTLEREAR
ncbi:MAG: hypothetical protein IBJ07_12025 [Rhizobiaceae bacterium]|nr:hypothetical protein [Rhizobiaceae bacterium]